MSLEEQAARIAELEAERALFVEPGSTLEAAIKRIHVLGAQVAALQEVAMEERARLIARCVHDCPEGGCLVDEERISETVKALESDLQKEARRQLAEEHPGAF